MNLLRPVLLLLAALLACAPAWGQMIGFRAAASAGVAASPPTPAFQAAGAALTGTGAVSPVWPAHVAGDVALLFVESAGGQAATLSTTAGFAAVANSPQATGAGTAGTRITVFWARATSGAMAAPTVADPGDHVYAQILTYRNVIAAGNPWDVTAGGVKTPASAAVSVTGVTTTVDNTRVVQAVARDNDSAAAAFSAQANGTLTGIAERADAGTVSNNGGGFAVWDGVKATAGATGNTTATVTSSINAFLTIALLPTAANSLTVNVPAGTTTGDVMVAAVAVTGAAAAINTPTGWTLQNTTVQAAANASRQAIYTRVVVGAEPANYTWTFSAAHTGAVGAIATYTDVDTTTPVDIVAGNTTPAGADTSLQHRATGVTTTVPDTLVVTTHSVASARPWTPTTIIERADILSAAAGAAGISLSINDTPQVNAGATGNKLSSILLDGDSGVAQILALRPNALGPVLEWVMDESTWTGAALQILDSSGSALHGQSFGTAQNANLAPAIAGTPGTCRYGTFDGNDGNYLQVADNALLDITDELTVMAWLRPTAYPTGGNLKSWMSKDGNYEAHLTSAGLVDWWWGGGAQELFSVGTLPLNGWTHVTLVYSRAGGFQRIYLNGVLDASGANANVALVANAMPFQVGADQGFAGRNFPGQIDEVRVFRQALGAGRIAQYMNTTRVCPASINHFSISIVGPGIACDTQQITITAHDASHSPVDANATFVNLSTSNAKGTWTGILAGGGTLNDVTAGDGVATYQFAVGSNSVQLGFRYADLVATSETFNFNVVGGGFSETSNAANASDDPPFLMSQAGFRFRNVTDNNTTIPTQISGKPSDTGWNAKTLRVQAIRTDTATGSCVGLFGSQTRSVDLGAECNNPATCQGQQVVVAGTVATAIATSDSNGGAGASNYTPVPLAFNAASEADTVITYTDAGQISLHARYDLDPPVAGFEAVGSSNAFVVRPFGLAFPGVTHATTAASGVLAAAGDNFSMTVRAYQWVSGEDANNDGIPDAGVNITNNATVPNFAATATVSASANLPGVATGAVSRGVGCGGAATIDLTIVGGGAATASDWCYSEAGNVFLNAAVNDYLGSTDADIAGNSGMDGTGAANGYVGRFKPKYFGVAGTLTRTNRSTLSCAPASTFTYMNEEMSLGFSLEARNTQNAITQNYNGTYAKLDLATAASLGIGARSGATNLTPRVDSTLVPSGSFANGVAALVARTGIRRASPDAADGPYTGTQFGIAPNDGDPNLAGGVQLNTFDLDVDNAGGNDHKLIGATTELRFGRLSCQNAFGSQASALPIPLSAQYWNGTTFATNTLDSCTPLVAGNVSYGNFRNNLAPAELGAPTVTAPANGVGSILLPKPSGGDGDYRGALDVTVGLIAAGRNYLLGSWSAANPDADATTSYDDNPVCGAAFGLYGSQPNNFIFFRENF